MIRPETAPYGEQFQARKLLVAKATDEQIEAVAVSANLSVYRFADGSFIEWRKYGHQAFAPNGHNITPREDDRHKYTEEYELSNVARELRVRVKPGTDMDENNIRALCVETGEFVRFHGYQWRAEKVEVSA